MAMRVGRYWGYIVLVLLLTFWRSGDLKPGLVFALGLITTGYFLFLVPVWGGAQTRQDMLCRNNSSGLLRGCHLREHKWQRLRAALISHRWRALNRGLWTSPKEALATVATLVSIVATIVTGALAVL